MVGIKSWHGVIWSVILLSYMPTACRMNSGASTGSDIRSHKRPDLVFQGNATSKMDVSIESEYIERYFQNQNGMGNDSQMITNWNAWNGGPVAVAIRISDEDCAGTLCHVKDLVVHLNSNWQSFFVQASATGKITGVLQYLTAKQKSWRKHSKNLSTEVILGMAKQFQSELDYQIRFEKKMACDAIQAAKNEQKNIELFNSYQDYRQALDGWNSELPNRADWVTFEKNSMPTWEDPRIWPSDCPVGLAWQKK